MRVKRTKGLKELVSTSQHISALVEPFCATNSVVSFCATNSVCGGAGCKGRKIVYTYFNRYGKVRKNPTLLIAI